MKRKIDDQIGPKFAIAAGMLMARIFSTPLKPNPRRCSFAAGPASGGSGLARPKPDSMFDVVGLEVIRSNCRLSNDGSAWGAGVRSHAGSRRDGRGGRAGVPWVCPGSWQIDELDAVAVSIGRTS